MKLSPQDLDQQDNDRLDRLLKGGNIRGVFSSPPTTHVACKSRQDAPEDTLTDHQLTGTPRTIVHHRHGVMPTLDTIES